MNLKCGDNVSMLPRRYLLPIPFEESWSLDERVIATRVYINMVCSYLDTILLVCVYIIISSQRRYEAVDLCQLVTNEGSVITK